MQFEEAGIAVFGEAHGFQIPRIESRLAPPIVQRLAVGVAQGSGFFERKRTGHQPAAQAAQAEKARAKAEILSKKKLEDTFEIRDWVRAMGPDYQNRIQQALAADPQLDIFAWLKQNFGVEVSDGAKLEGIMYLSP